jgi:formamidopyrimidine-DNA glycosylase
MPELPEAERARQRLESVLGRRIAAVDDTDTYVCRPHQPGEIASALVGHEFASAHRRGKFLWMETEDGPTLGLHLGMAGAIALEAPDERPLWDRFTVRFDDGTRFALRDRRRLGRAVLDPDFAHVGPDAALVGREEFRALIGRGKAPVKVRLLDQGAISGVGNLLADEALWRARLAPRHVTGELSTEELDRLRRAVRAATRDAIRDGGVHTGRFVAARGREGACPRCGHALSRATVGGRTTYWCPECQA